MERSDTTGIDAVGSDQDRQESHDKWWHGKGEVRQERRGEDCIALSGTEKDRRGGAGLDRRVKSWRVSFEKCMG